MSEDRDNVLPYGARGMDLDRFSWEVRPDGKVHFIAKERGGSHWTLHTRTMSGTLDLHETSVNPDGTKSHKTLFMMKADDIAKVLNELGPIAIPDLLRQIRPLSLRWLRRRRISIVRDPTSTDAELAAITNMNRRGRLELDMERLGEALDKAWSPDELLRMPDGSFSLMAIRRWGTRRIGVGWKATDSAGIAHLFWARLEDLLGWGEKMKGVFSGVVEKYSIPPEDYSRYFNS